MRVLKEHVAIVGGGTAGMIAARALSRRGIKTTVYEQKSVIGYPIHASGILSLNGLSGLGIDYRGAMTNTLRGANLHAAGGTLRVMTREPVAAVLDRKRLNEICRDEAEDAGANVAVRRRITPSDLNSMGKDNVIVGADGAVSAVARHFSMGRIARHVLTFKAEYNISAQEPEVVDLFFDRRIYKGLFAWICPNAKDIVEIGIGVDSGFMNSKLAFERFLQTKEVAGLIDGSRPMAEGASMIPMARRERIVDEEREVLLVGDAAGQVKATTGGGIIFGGNAALMAARAIDARMKEGKNLSDYERMYMNEYGMEMRLHSFVNKFYSSMSPGGLAKMIKLAKAVGMEGFLSKYGDMDLPSLMIKRFFLRSLAD